MLQQIVKNWKAKTSAERLAVRILHALHNAGFDQSYIVGGYVRDLFLRRKETGAIDIATEATPSQVTKLMQKSGYRVIPTGLKHGTVTVHKGTDDIEITTFRKEGKYSDARRPDEVMYIRDPKLDAARRDFTINALYFNPRGRELLDFYGGIDDIRKKRLRFVGSASDRLKEDALRLMRAVRFSAIFNFSISPADAATVRKFAHSIDQVSPERIKQELDKIVLSARAAHGMRMLFDLRLLKNIMPDYARLTQVAQSDNFHSEGNVLTHTLLALAKLQPDADLPTRYGLFFHDVGKGLTAEKTTKQGRPHVRFYGHQEAGARSAEKIMEQLRFSRREIEDVSWYVRNHHVPFELPKMRRAKQMAWCLDPRFENLLKIFRADSLASIPTDERGRQMKPSLAAYRRAKKIFQSARTQKNLDKPLVNGNDVMKMFRIHPSPEVGKLLRLIRERQLEGNLKTRKAALAALRELKKIDTK